MMFTGEETVAPLAGAQIVTEGLVELSAHGAAKAGKADATIARKSEIRRSLLIICVPEVVSVLCLIKSCAGMKPTTQLLSKSPLLLLFWCLVYRTRIGE